MDHRTPSSPTPRRLPPCGGAFATENSMHHETPPSTAASDPRRLQAALCSALGQRGLEGTVEYGLSDYIVHAELPDGSSLIISPPQELPSEHPRVPGKLDGHPPPVRRACRLRGDLRLRAGRSACAPRRQRAGSPLRCRRPPGPAWRTTTPGAGTFQRGARRHRAPARLRSIPGECRSRLFAVGRPARAPDWSAAGVFRAGRAAVGQFLIRPPALTDRDPGVLRARHPQN